MAPWFVHFHCTALPCSVVDVTTRSQIIPPVDAGILKSITENLEPWQEYDYSEEAVLGNELCLEQRAELGQLYIDTMTEKLCRRKEANAVRSCVRACVWQCGWALEARTAHSWGQNRTGIRRSDRLHCHARRGARVGDASVQRVRPRGTCGDTPAGQARP